MLNLASQNMGAKKKKLPTPNVSILSGFPSVPGLVVLHRMLSAAALSSWLTLAEVTAKLRLWMQIL